MNKASGEIELESAILKKDKANGIIKIKYKDDTIVKLYNAKQHLEALKTLTNNKPHPFLADFKDIYTNITPEATEFFAKSEELNSIRSALALLINTPALRLKGDFFKNFHQVPCPFKITDDEEEAIEWLQQYR